MAILVKAMSYGVNGKVYKFEEMVERAQKSEHIVLPDSKEFSSWVYLFEDGFPDEMTYEEYLSAYVPEDDDDEPEEFTPHVYVISSSNRSQPERAIFESSYDYALLMVLKFTPEYFGFDENSIIEGICNDEEVEYDPEIHVPAFPQAF